MSLNFARHPFRNDRPARVAYAALALLLGVVTTLHAVRLTRYLLREGEEMDEKAEALRNERDANAAQLETSRATLMSPRSPVADQRIEFLAELLRRRTFSWTGFFNELESITPPNIRITAIGHDEQKGVTKVRLVVVGRSLDDVLELIRKLEDSDLFAAVLPLDEGEQDARQGSGVSATLVLNYTARTAPRTPQAPAAPAEAAGAAVPSGS